MTSPYVSPTLVDTHANLPATATLNHVAIVADDDGAGHGAIYRGTGSAWAAFALTVAVVSPGTNGQVYATVSGAAAWATVGGDVTGAPSALVVGKVKGTTVTTAGGALTTGQSLRVTGAATADWGAVDLANSNAITGALPLASVAQGGAATGQALVWSGSAWAPASVALGARTITTTAPITIDGTTSADLSANRTIAITDATTAALGSIKLAADLRGTGLLPTVIGLTGIANVVEMHGTTIQWDSGVTTPIITQATQAGAGAILEIRAQGSSGSIGGTLALEGGNGTTAGSVIISNGTSSPAMILTTTEIQVSRASVLFTTVSNPTISQIPRTAAGVGTPLLVMGQSCTGSATTGANAIFASGLGNAGLGSAAGKVILSWGNVVDALVIDPTTDTITSEVKSFRWAADVTAPAIYQIEATSGNGQPFTFNGQDGNQTSGNNNGGSVFVNGGAKRGSGVDGNVVLSNGGSTGLTVKPASIDIARTILNFSTDAIINAASAHPIVFQIGGATRAELDPDGVLRIGDVLSAVSAPGSGIDLYSVGGRPTMFGSNASAVEVQWQNTVTASAIAGSALLPISPVEFLTLFVNGNFRTIPLYR